MTISIEDVENQSDTHSTYTVTFFTDQINTLLTHTPSIAHNWIIANIPNNSTNNLIVGLDVEWRPSINRNIDDRVSIVQLCIGHNCLIFQLLYANHIPQSLIDFLNNPNFTFVGVGIDEDVEKLLCDYELRVAKTVDLRSLAATKLDLKELKNAGLKDLSKRVLGKNIEKPKKVTMSRWDAEWLSHAQIQYACLDAFLSFEIGRNLLARS